VARGFLLSDWTVTWDGKHGTVSCSRYAGRFTMFRKRFVRLRWVDGPLRNLQTIERAAKEAAALAVNG
jgi:hypothetical protein